MRRCDDGADRQLLTAGRRAADSPLRPAWHGGACLLYTSRCV
ncbi:hypothetical protein [Arthrobacter sp. KBS0703]|nr:hypothetical protein [Arthrobacter sp. KBS0703]